MPDDAADAPFASHVESMIHIETLETIRKLILITYLFLTTSFVVLGTIALLLVLKLNHESVSIFSEFLDTVGWWAIVLAGAPIAGYIVTYAVSPSLIQKSFYSGIELREESAGVQNQMMQLEEHINTLVTVVNQCSEVANLCSESARECGVSANESRTATGRLEDEIRGLKHAASRAYEIVGMLDEGSELFGAKITELSDNIESLDKILVDLKDGQEKVLEEALQPVKNSLLALRKENVQLHRTSVERIKTLEDLDEDLHEFLLELVHGVSSAYRSHEDRKRVT